MGGRFSWWGLFLVIGIFGQLNAASAQSADAIDPFIGSYVGRSDAEGLDKRDMAVTIRHADKGGFTVDWNTVTYKSGGRANRKAYSITFNPSKRPGVFASAMRRNKFGAAVPLDPIEGEPFVWARMEGKTLSVFALSIDDDGTYDMQTYERSLSAEGLDLAFTRIRDGSAPRTVRGQLRRVKK